MADAAVDHRQHQLGARLIGADREHRDAHHIAHRGLEREPGGDDAGAQVAIGDDPELAVPEIDEDRAHPLLLHPGCGLAQVHTRLADHRALPDQGPNSLLAGVEAAGPRGRRATRPRSVHQRPGHRSQPRRVAEQRDHLVRREPVAERVLARAGLPAGRKPGEHPRVPERLALAEQVEHAPVVSQLDGACAHHPHRVGRPLTLAEDRRPGLEVLDLDPLREPLGLFGLERNERIVRPQELSDVVHTVGSPAYARR